MFNGVKNMVVPDVQPHTGLWNTRTVGHATDRESLTGFGGLDHRLPQIDDDIRHVEAALRRDLDFRGGLLS